MSRHSWAWRWIGRPTVVVVALLPVLAVLYVFLYGFLLALFVAGVVPDGLVDVASEPFGWIAILGFVTLVVVAGSIEALTPIDWFVVLGVVAILPLATPSRWWPVAAAGVFVALQIPVGWSAGVWALPWVVVAVALLLQGRTQWVEAVGAGFGVVAAGWFLASRLGWEPFGVREPIVELTTVHYTFAGVGGLTLARLNRSPVAMVLMVVGPPVVALGFLTHGAGAQVGGAVLMTAAAWTIGALHLRIAWRSTRPVAGRVLFAVSGTSAWIPMVLALAWAAGQHWDVPAMSISDMARVHGTLNGLGFTLCGLLAWRAGERQTHATSRDRHRSSVADRTGAAPA